MIKITKLEAEKAELEAKNSELLKRIIEETTKYDELRVRIEELEKNKTDTAKLVSENVELRDRVMKVEQRQLQNDNSPNNGLSNFNSVAENHGKLLENKEMDGFSSEEPVVIPDSVIAQLEQCMCGIKGTCQLSAYSRSSWLVKTIRGTRVRFMWSGWFNSHPQIKDQGDIGGKGN